MSIFAFFRPPISFEYVVPFILAAALILAIQSFLKSLNYAYIGRKHRKRDFRKLWIARINAAARLNGTSYSKLMGGLKKANIDINRKMLAELAVNNPEEFAKLVEAAK